jgi:hypothetical protein
MRALGSSTVEGYFVPNSVLDSTKCCGHKQWVPAELKATLANATALKIPAFISLGNGQSPHGKSSGSPVSPTWFLRVRRLCFTEAPVGGVAVLPWQLRHC